MSDGLPTPTTETRLPVPNETGRLAARLHRFAINRRPLSPEAAEDELEKLDRGLLREAERLGFQRVGVARERGLWAVSYPTVYLLGPGRQVELLLSRPRTSRNETVWEMRMTISDGTVVCLSPDPPHGRGGSRPLGEGEGARLVSLPQHDSLEEGLAYLRDAADHHRSKTTASEAALVPVDDFGQSLRRTDRFDALFSSRGELIRRVGKVALPGAYVLLILLVPVLIILL